MVAIIREADHEPVATMAKRRGVSGLTWRKRFLGGLQRPTSNG
jgi:hypothetical protein